MTALTGLRTIDPQRRCGNPIKLMIGRAASSRVLVKKRLAQVLKLGNAVRQRLDATPTEDGVVNLLRLRSKTEATAVRTDHACGKLWERDGDGLDNLYHLVELPALRSTLAPHLGVSSVPQAWTP